MSQFVARSIGSQKVSSFFLIYSTQTTTTTTKTARSKLSERRISTYTHTQSGRQSVRTGKSQSLLLFSCCCCSFNCLNRAPSGMNIFSLFLSLSSNSTALSMCCAARPQLSSLHKNSLREPRKRSRWRQTNSPQTTTTKQ